MKRPTTLILFALAAIAGGVLYGVAFEVSALEEELIALNKDITRDRNAIHVLRAEWSYLNQPERLEGLSERYLELQPLDGAQLSAVTVLPVRQVDDAAPPQSALEETTPEPTPAATPAAPEPAIAGLFTGVPKAKPAAPRRPSARVQLAAQPARAKPAPSPNVKFDNVLRAVLGDSFGDNPGGSR